MIIRQVEANHWKHIYNQIIRYGKTTPLSLQFDIEINCNGVNYVLKVQPDRNRKIVALQAMGVYPDGNGIGGKDYHLIEDNRILSSLLEILIYQGASIRR